MTDAGQWARVTAVFHDALEREEPARAAYLDSACANDGLLRAEVESLLASHQAAGRFAEGSPLDALPLSAVEALGLHPGLAPGSQLGSYAIVAPIGAGGMGEVYRARDTRLGRDVAIKALPQQFLTDSDRVARFEREGQMLAALNHPNIAAIHGLEESNGSHVLVLEFVEGESLAERVARGRIGLAESLGIIRQIIDALEAAHEKGIIHRDLKPANVMLTAEDRVKVLDFGLAKLGDAGAEDQPHSTAARVIVGTAAYMSPEQASGRAVDKRTDIWACGAVLYEMLTRRQAFSGQTRAEIFAAVPRAEPAWDELPPTAPPGVRRLLQRCLAKDPRERLRDIGDARWELKETTEFEGAPRSLARPWKWLTAALLAAVGGMGWIVTSSSPSEVADLTFSIVPPPGTVLTGEGRSSSAPEISPDGRSLLLSTSSAKYVRRVDTLEPLFLPGVFSTWPAFWLPDGASVAWREIPGGRLVRLRLPRGAPEVLGTLSVPDRGIAWSDSGDMLIASAATPGSSGALMQWAPTRADARQIRIVGLDRAGDFYQPEFLPGGSDFLFLFVPADGGGPEIYLATLRNGAAENPVLLLKNDTAARFTPAGGGRLLFVRNDDLYAQKLNRRSRRLEGDAESIVKGVVSQPGNSVHRAEFSVARTGAVAWRPGRAALSQITIFDRQGAVVGTAGPPSSINSIVLSPDETRLLAHEDRDAWVVEVNQPGRVKLPSRIHWFDWSADGETLVGMRGATEVVEARADGTPAVAGKGTLAGPVVGGSYDMAPNGRDLLAMNAGGSAIVAARIDGAPEVRMPQVLAKANEQVFHPRVAPDGRWMVYVARENIETIGIFVQPFPGPGRRRQIASNGSSPEWRADGKEIVYIGVDGIWSIAVAGVGNDLRFGTPQRLFSANLNLRGPGGPGIPARRLAVSRDGSRFFFPLRREQPEANVIHVRTGSWVKRVDAQ